MLIKMEKPNVIFRTSFYRQDNNNMISSNTVGFLSKCKLAHTQYLKTTVHTTLVLSNYTKINYTHLHTIPTQLDAIETDGVSYSYYLSNFTCASYRYWSFF